MPGLGLMQGITESLAGRVAVLCLREADLPLSADLTAIPFRHL
jgi:hypothetical protein